MVRLRPWPQGRNSEGEKSLQPYRQVSNLSRYVALVAVLTALYSVYGYVSGIALRSLTLSLDLFFLLPVFFAVLVSLSGRRWSSTLFGTIIGLLFLYPSPNVPIPYHIGISLIINGLVFDLYLRETGSSLYELSRRQLVTAAILGNFSMAVAGLLIFQIFSQPQAALLWGFKLFTDPLVGAFGGFFGATVVERVKGVQARRTLEARSSLRIKN